MIHGPRLSRNFFGRSLWGKGVGKPRRKNFCPGGAYLYYIYIYICACFSYLHIIYIHIH